jgi:hypothetical protein
MMFWMEAYQKAQEAYLNWLKLFAPKDPGLEVVYRRGNVTFVRRPEPHRSSA